MSYVVYIIYIYIAYGFGGAEYFPDPKDYYKYNNDKGSFDFFKPNIEVDMLLDLDKKEFRCCIVGHDRNKELKLWNLPKKDDGWVPHIGLWEKNIQLRIAKIQVDWYAINKNDIFKLLSTTQCI